MTDPNKPLNLSLARTLQDLHREPNAACPFPGCGASWFSAEYEAFRSVDIATMCPRCKQGVRLRHLDGTEEFKACVQCGGQVHPRQIWDMPFAVDFSAQACHRCNIIRHLTRKFPDQVQAALDAALPAEPEPEEAEECPHLSFRITEQGSVCVKCGAPESDEP